MRSKLLVVAGILLAMFASAQAVTVEAEWSVSGGPGSPGGFGCSYTTGGSPGGTGWTGDEIFTINEIGHGGTSPQYYMNPTHANAQVQWMNSEMLLTAFATETPGDYRSAYGAAVQVRNASLKYLMGVRVTDNGDSTYTTTVDLIDCQTGSLTHPPLIGSYVLPDTGRNQHRYNVEVTNVATRAVSLFVDGNPTPVITGTAGAGIGLPPTPVELGIGDLRGGWNSPTVFPNAHVELNRVAFSTEPIIPEPASMLILLCGSVFALRKRK